MLVNASQFPAPAMWQGLMLIGVAVWIAYIFTGDILAKSFKGSIAALLAYTVGVSVLVAKMF